MTSTSLFDGYLTPNDRSQTRPALSQRRTDSLASLSGYGDEPSASFPSPVPSMSPSRTRVGDGELLSTPRDLHAMEEEEERPEDDNNTVIPETDDPSVSRGPSSQSGSAMPTPTQSTLTFNENPPKQSSSSSSRTAIQPQQQPSPAPSQVPPQIPRKPLPQPQTTQKYRHTPRLPNHNAEAVSPTTVPYWSRAPVYGHLPTRNMRAHTVTLIDNVAWQIGGCDHQSCSREVLTFDTETMQWAHPETVGDLPPPCRAHSATQVDRRIFIFGGGEGPMYYNHLYVLDTVLRRWNKVTAVPGTPEPMTRRAHTTWFYQGKVYLFGGGNGARALNDLWAFDAGMGPPYDKLRWEQLEVRGPKPSPRGYHTANLINNVVVIIGGSDGSACFEDVWVLNLERLTWHEVELEVPRKRLSHTSTQVGSYLFVMGGHDGNKYNHDLLLFNLVTLQWEVRETRGRHPSSRGYHAAILADSRLFVIGGFDGHTVYDDVFILDLAAAAYLPQVKSFELTLN